MHDTIASSEGEGTRKYDTIQRQQQLRREFQIFCLNYMQASVEKSANFQKKKSLKYKNKHEKTDIYIYIQARL